MRILERTKNFPLPKIPKGSQLFYIIPFFAAAFITLLVSLILVAIHFTDSASNIILHFDFYRGIDAIGSASTLYQILGLSGVIFILNAFLAKTLFTREPFLTYFFAIGTFLFSVLIFAAMWVIIGVN